VSATESSIRREKDDKREREREKFIDNQIDDGRSVGTPPLAVDTASLGTRGPAYGGEYYTPTLRLALWHAFQQHTRGTRPSPVRPERERENARAREREFDGAQ
jgi:hypothetical protein